MQSIQNRFQNDADLLEIMANTSIFSNDVDKRVRMANLCIVGSHKVNGVSELHTSILRDSIFRYFDRIQPDQIINITNGITPRRWLLQCNPGTFYTRSLFQKSPRLSPNWSDPRRGQRISRLSRCWKTMLKTNPFRVDGRKRIRRASIA